MILYRKIEDKNEMDSQDDDMEKLNNWIDLGRNKV